LAVITATVLPRTKFFARNPKSHTMAFAGPES